MEAESRTLLKRVIESQHGGIGTFVQSVRILRQSSDTASWDGVVHVFDLEGNPNASRAYAWAAPITGSTCSRYFAVLHQGRVRGPAEAVKAAVAAIKAWG